MAIRYQDRGSPLGRLVRSFGEGLAESLPEEVKRQRLSRGLEDFQKNRQGKNALEQAIDLYKIPGFTPEMGYTLQPLLQQQGIREEQQIQNRPSESEMGNVPIKSTNIPKNISNTGQYAEETAKGASQPTIKSLSSTQAEVAPIIRKSGDQLRDEAIEESNANPRTFPTWADALPFVTQREQSRIANLEEQRGQGAREERLSQNLTRQIKEKMGIKTQKSPEGVVSETASVIPSTLQNELFNQAEAEFANPKNKLSEKQLAEKYGEIGNNIARSVTNLTTTGEQSYFNKSPTDARRSIDISREPFKKLGSKGLQTYRDLLISTQDLTPMKASYLTYRIDENKPLNNYIAKLPEISTLERLVLPSELPEDQIIYNQILPMIGDNDSLLSVAQALNSKGYNGETFLNYAKKNPSLRLNEYQRQELQQPSSNYPSLGDLFLFTLTGQDQIVEQK